MGQFHFTLLGGLLLAMTTSGPALAADQVKNLCKTMSLANRLPAQASTLLDPNASNLQATRYLRGLQELRNRAGRTTAAKPMPKDLDNSLTKSIILHLRFVDLLRDNPSAARELVQSREWRQTNAQISGGMRDHGCDKASTDATPSKQKAQISTLGSQRNAGGDQSESTSQTTGSVLEFARSSPIAFTLALLVALALPVIAFIILARQRRVYHRKTCDIPTAVQGPSYCESSSILDLTTLGCKLSLKEKLPIGSPITVFFPQFAIKAKVKWANAHYMGVAFETPLSDEQFANALNPSPDIDFDAPGSLSLACHTGTCRDTCSKYQLFQQEKQNRA